MNPGEAVLELRRVTKRFGAQVAVDALSLSLAAWATTVLIGPSGCGKSTLLPLMNGLPTPDAGTVTFAGEPVAPETVMALRRRMGYVIQEGGLFPHLTARENVSLMGRFLGWPRQAMDARIGELAALTHLSAKLLERYPAELSGGQRQRIALMRALMLAPRCCWSVSPPRRPWPSPSPSAPTCTPPTRRSATTTSPCWRTT